VVNLFNYFLATAHSEPWFFFVFLVFSLACALFACRFSRAAMVARASSVNAEYEIAASILSLISFSMIEKGA